MARLARLHAGMKNHCCYPLMAPPSMPSTAAYQAVEIPPPIRHDVANPIPRRDPPNGYFNGPLELMISAVWRKHGLAMLLVDRAPRRHDQIRIGKRRERTSNNQPREQVQYHR